MKLPAWLKAEDKTQAWLANRIEVHVMTVWRYCHGKRRPSPAKMARLTRVTGGKVTANDFVDPPRRARRKAYRKPAGAKAAAPASVVSP